MLHVCGMREARPGGLQGVRETGPLPLGNQSLAAGKAVVFTMEGFHWSIDCEKLVCRFLQTA